MLQVHVSPEAARQALDGSEALARLCSGDALDTAMYGSSLLAIVLREAEHAGATEVVLDVEGAGEVHEQMAAAQGMTEVRDLLQLERPLPVSAPWTIEVRPFEPDRDEAAWLEVNNRAFAWHPDQSDWTLDDLRARMGERWFDPAGFLLHEEDGRLLGFCWTKVHDLEHPPLGEIYVIGVDPDAQGRGLGRELVLAGLGRLAEQGLTIGMLWVEAGNGPALALYRDLGFEERAHRRWWRWRPRDDAPVGSAGSTGTAP